MKQLPVRPTHTESVLGLGYMGLQLLVLPVALTMIATFFQLDLSESQLNFVFFALNFVCLSVIAHRFLIDSVKVGFARPFMLLHCAVIAYGVNWASLFVINTLFAQWLPGFSNVNDSSIAQMVASDYTLNAIGMVLLVPLAEEVMYRGFIFGLLHRSSRLAAYLVSVLVFAAIHVVGYIGYYDAVTLLLCLVQYLPAGLCLAWAYERSGSILAPILIHMAVNQTSILSLR